MQIHISELNEAQRAAATHIDGPLMIVAGAGTGKTKVLTTRIAYLMSQGVDAFNILALTFTNKAAKEMKDRIEKILGSGDVRNLFIGTFHSVFARLLRAEATKLGYPSNFTIYDTEDSRSVIKGILKVMQLDDKIYKPNWVSSRISIAKNALLTTADYAGDFSLRQEDIRSNHPDFYKIYAAYAARCYKNGAMDFDDLLLKMYELLSNFPEVLYKYQNKFKYILIDEYQDTNQVQYRIAKLLASVHENICVVGDDAQSIYSFRGATIQNILDFQKDYADVSVVKLEQNYRSSKSILTVANEVIKKNSKQIAKKLWTENIDGEKLTCVTTMSDNEEGRFVADSIKEQKLRNHYNNSDIAILYRTNAQSRAFEESLRRSGIAYRIYGGMSFYQRKEIKDMLAYLRFIVNTKDEEALKKIINYPARGIGQTTIEKIGLVAFEQNIPMFDVVTRSIEFGFKASTSELLKNFSTMIKYFQSLLPTMDAHDMAQQVGKNTNLIKELFNDKTVEGAVRYENLQELLNAMKEWTESPTNDDGEWGDKSLGSYLQQIALITDADTDVQNGDTVTLMTVHAAKGLEYKCVFLVGLEENIFPSSMSVNSRDELEEERRLFYVAITRAKERLWITNAQNRYRFGQLVYNAPSQFLKELPEEQVVQSASGYAGGYTSKNVSNNNLPRDEKWAIGNKNYSATGVAKPAYMPIAAIPNVVLHIPDKNFQPSDLSDIEIGNRVEHQKFGFGSISKIEGSAHNPIAHIEFEKNGEKKIMLNYAKLRILK